MLQKVEAIILRAIKYGDSSVILKTFSRSNGVMSFIASVSRKSKAGMKPSLLQPLNQLELIYYGKARGELKRLKEATIAYNYHTLPYDAVKSCLGIFLAEVLQHLLQEEEPHPDLYDFLQKSLHQLDEESGSVANFHLVFLMRLSQLLGFAPERISIEAQPLYFDLAEGRYSSFEPSHRYFISGSALERWRELQQYRLKDYQNFKIGSEARAQLLETLLEFVRLHVTDFGELKSLKVLRQVLH